VSGMASASLAPFNKTNSLFWFLDFRFLDFRNEWGRGTICFLIFGSERREGERVFWFFGTSDVKGAHAAFG
jgi:hypothetical protein